MSLDTAEIIARDADNLPIARGRLEYALEQHGFKVEPQGHVIATGAGYPTYAGHPLPAAFIGTPARMHEGKIIGEKTDYELVNLDEERLAAYHEKLREIFKAF